ncbi:NAD(P)H-dependent oxidoreductase [Orbus sturtevantii]|uniref:FMN-dependent NADH-azoreductase n=1 Tax=Orbus sturtevantii TaxID=3074109 RepID=UPI00370D62AD
MKILCLKSSILNDFSTSNLLINELIDHLKANNKDVSVIERELGINPPAHLTLDVLTAIRTHDISKLTDKQKNNYDEILTSIEQLKSADLVIIGSPMHNLSISSGLKTWIDQICQAGLTFSYTEQGPKGLVDDKPVIIVSSRGGIYSTPPLDVLDHQEPYLKAIFGLIGITNIKYIRAEGTNISEELKDKAIAQAKYEISLL